MCKYLLLKDCQQLLAVSEVGPGPGMFAQLYNTYKCQITFLALHVKQPVKIKRERERGGGAAFRSSHLCCSPRKALVHFGVPLKVLRLGGTQLNCCLAAETPWLADSISRTPLKDFFFLSTKITCFWDDNISATEARLRIQMSVSMMSCLQNTDVFTWGCRCCRWSSSCSVFTCRPRAVFVICVWH